MSERQRQKIPDERLVTVCGSGDYVTKYINGFVDARHVKYDFLMQMGERINVCVGIVSNESKMPGYTCV